MMNIDYYHYEKIVRNVKPMFSSMTNFLLLYNPAFDER